MVEHTFHIQCNVFRKRIYIFKININFAAIYASYLVILKSGNGLFDCVANWNNSSYLYISMANLAL